MVGVDFQDLLEVRQRVVICRRAEDLCLLNLIHEGGVAVGVSHNNAGLVSESA